MAENTREIVLDTLLEMERNKVYSHQLIKSVLDKYEYLGIQDKRFMKRLLEGTIERKIELDYVINQFSSVPIHKMKPLIRCLMRMSVYQLLYMDSIPDSAVCNEAVKLANKRKFVNLKGFVNGVLRKIATNKEIIIWPDKKKSPSYYLSILYSMPEWIVIQWLEDYGYETTETVIKALLEIHPISIRFADDISEAVRKEYISIWEGLQVKVRQSPYLDYAYLLEGVDGITNLPGYTEGVFIVQDVSSMLAIEAAHIKPEDSVLDICAAPGGKSLLAAQYAKHVISRDVSEYKTQYIQENAKRMRMSEKVEVEVWDATQKDQTKINTVDILIMDVPCSGLGVIGKKRDIKYNVTKEGFESLLLLQKEIVSNSWEYLKQDGILLYSTCTIHKKENEEMCEWIREMFPFELIEQKQILPGIMEADGFSYAIFRRV